MDRWIKVLACVLVALAALVCGLLVPAHLRAVDEGVIERAGQKTPTLIERGLALVYERKPGAARMLLLAAQQEKVPGHGTLRDAVDTLARQSPDLDVWGAEPPSALTLNSNNSSGGSVPVTELVIPLENREKALARLEAAPGAAVQELLRFRTVTNTTIFPPSESASGQALDAALVISGLLLEEGRLAPGLSNALVSAAVAANRGNPHPFEQLLADGMSLGQRLNWGQLISFVSRIENAETLYRLADQARTANERLPVLFAVVQLSNDPSAVAEYLVNFSRSGLADLAASLRFGAGGVDELLRRNVPLHKSGIRGRLGLDLSLHQRGFALTVKWFLYLLSGFLLALALHYARPPVAAAERPLQVRGVHIVREILFGLGFLLVVLFLSEPFLAQESQRAEFRLQLRVPTVGSGVPAGKPGDHSSLMNQTVLLTMLLFLVLQSLLYLASLLKLAEIRRQRVPARVKLRLLENEDHLFDAGLYLGFLGTIVSLILVSLGVFKQPSLMAAYSATCFGILFVVAFKVLNLRPARRKLLLESEAGPTTPPIPQSAPPSSFAAPL